MEEDEVIENEENNSCKDRLGYILHNKIFHGVLIALIIADVVIVLVLLFVDLDVIPVPGETEEERENNKLKVEHGLHYLGLTFLSIFIIEIILRIIVDGKKFFKEKLYVFDAAIVFLSFTLDLALTYAPVSNAVRDGVILMILLRLWRFFKLICAINICVRKDVKEEIEKERRKRKEVERERDQYKQELNKLKHVKDST